MSAELLDYAIQFDACLKRSGRSCVTVTYSMPVEAEDEDGSKIIVYSPTQETAQCWEELRAILDEAFGGSPFVTADDVERAMRSMSDE